jgi:integrase/recombinase XerD
MNLEEGINLYVKHKQANGFSYETGCRTFHAFLKTVGNLPLDQLSVRHGLQFLDRDGTSTGSFRRHYSYLLGFYQYWFARGGIAKIPMPPNRPAQRSRFLPYIFSRGELRGIFRLIQGSQEHCDKIHDRTVRAVLLTLYATGATVGEVTGLIKRDVDMLHGYITFSGTRYYKPRRRIPIGKDLVRTIRQYAAWQERWGAQGDLLFSRIDGTKIAWSRLNSRFRRLCQAAGIAGYRGSSQSPCPRDLRATFAVHRITSWIRKKEDLNHLIPALAAYMGYAGLESAEHYLHLTPTRFQSALNKLSPPKLHTRWRDDSGLLEFLINF